MVFATLLPLGITQLWRSVNDGYFEARSMSYLTEPGNAVVEWLRMPGDTVFIVGGILPFLWITWLGIRSRIRTSDEDPQEGSFLEEGAALVGAPSAEPAQSGQRPSGYASDRRSDEGPSGAGPGG